MIGYGSQGRAIALNLRDSGYNVVVGLRPKSKSRKRAVGDRFQPETIEHAVAQSEIVTLAIPDHLHGSVWKKSIEPNLRRPKKQGAAAKKGPSAPTALFLHGTSIHFGLIKPPRTCDIIMIAPHAPGVAVRERFLGAKDISAFYAIDQNYSGIASQRLFAIAAGMGFAKQRLVKTTFASEAIGDLFGEQAVLCGGLSALIKGGFETLVRHGLKPEHAWLEVAYQLDLIIALIKSHGIAGMLDRISLAARYGAITTGPSIVNASTYQAMEAVYNRVENGLFVKELTSLSESEIKRLKTRYAALTSAQLEQAAKKRR